MSLRNVMLGIGILALIAGIALSALWLMQPPRSTAKNGDANGAGETDAGDTRSVLTATRPLASGTLLRSEDVAWKSMKLTELKAGYYVRGQGSSDVLGWVVRHDLAEGEPLNVGVLLSPSDRGFLAAVLPPGKRAVSIGVDAPQSGSGLILPDDRVDVVLTQTFGDTEVEQTRKSVGETVLRNLRVIAVDQRLGTYAPTQKTKSTVTAVAEATVPEARIPKTVTIEVTEKQAQQLLVANQLGKIQLSVRALESDESSEDSFEA